MHAGEGTGLVQSAGAGREGPPAASVESTNSACKHPTLLLLTLYGGGLPCCALGCSRKWPPRQRLVSK